MVKDIPERTLIVCAVVISAAFMLLNCLAQSTAPRFGKAEPVWAKGFAEALNASVRFKATFETQANEEPFLRITGTSAYRIRLNGRYVGYGPARSPKGFFRVDEWPLAAAIREGRNELEIDAAGYNCNSFYYQDQPAFVQAEVVANGQVLAATKAEGGDFSAESTARVRKVPRYSFQRTFAEAYRIGGGEPTRLALERRPLVRYLDRIASYPKFEMNERLRIVSRAKVAIDPRAKIKEVRFVNTDGKDPLFKAFAMNELDSNLWTEAQKVVLSNQVPCAQEPGEPFVLRRDESARMDAGLNDCGFFGMTVKVAKPGRLLFIFDEVLTDGRVSPTRANCCNCVEWSFARAGTYEVETFEPYVFRYAELVGLGGEFEISGLHVRAYKNPDAGRVAFRCSDPALEKVFEAARETFVQNAVDVFTDCPSRERAGWLCDSFFIGRVNKLLTGDTKLERLFLQNFAVSDGYEHIPAGAIPMCYPADQLNGRFIPNWAMWLVIEVEEYLKRSGDRETVDALKPRLVAFIDYLMTFRNADGLLEKLPSWVFVEWSQANKLVQDVNYPSNMTWAEVLDVMDRLYKMPALAVEAAKVREMVRRQSWTGKWFCDNAVRQKDGTLKLSGQCTETCQYYAFFFRTATPKTHPELWKTLVEDFGPKRLAEDRKTLKSHPEIGPSNAFIGNYLRLECLAREGLVGNILDETKGFFLYMAERTGTLWEMISPTASCDHGFASHAAVYLFRDILGVKSVDVNARKVMVEPPGDIGLEWAEGTLPVSPDEVVTVRWRRGEKPTVKFQMGERHVNDAQLTLATRGAAPRYTIVLPEAPSPSQAFAAVELQKYVCEMTGVTLPIATNATPARGIFLGNGASDLGNDGFRLVAAPPHFRIEGNGVHGTLFGVYDFLERSCGCEWLAPNCEVVPPRETIEVSATLDDVQRPAFPLRDLNWTDHLRHPGFSAKLKVNGFRIEYPEALGGRDHAKDTTTGGAIFDNLCPPGKYFKDHPEWFALINGKRRATRVQRCLTNRGFLDFLTEQMRERIRKNYPRCKYYSIYQNDHRDNCQCKECKALDEREGSPSATMVHMANYVAERVAKEYPDVNILTFAYLYTLKPPKTMKVHPNVMICYCTDACEFSKPIRESRWKGCKEFVENFKKWKAIANKIYIWDYSANFKYLFQPFECCHVMPANFQYFREMGVFGVFEEGDHYGVKCVDEALKTWVIGHLLWNPEQPLEPLLDRFFKGYYGAAADVARGYYEALVELERKRDELKDPLVMWGTKQNDPHQPIEFFHAWSAKWTAALELVADDPIRRENVYWARHNVDLVRLVRSKLGAKYSLSTRIADDLKNESLVLKPVAERMLADFARVKGLNKFRDNEMVRGRVVNIAKFNPTGTDARRDRLVIPVADMRIDDKTATKQIDDPLAVGGKAVRMGAAAPGEMHHCLAFREESFSKDPGARIGVRVHARVEKTDVAEGSAFSVGTCDIVSYKKRDIRDFHVGIQDVKGDKYEWYDVEGTWSPAGNETLWIGNGKRVKGENPSIKAVYFDQIELYRK